MTPSSPDPLAGLRAPEAPQHLKRRVLAEARGALDASPDPSLEDRLWSSWGLRLAWLVTVGALLAVNLVVAPAPVPDGGPRLAAGAATGAAEPPDVDNLPEPTRAPGGDRAAVLCELSIDCSGAEPEHQNRGDRA